MEGRSVAWIAYVPLPGLAFVPALAAPKDRLARYHAWQGGLLVSLLYAWLFLWGLAARPASDAARDVLGMMAGLGLLAGLVGLVWGAVGSALGRYVRIRPVWDLLRFAGR